jgi:hypothetical protein
MGISIGLRVNVVFSRRRIYRIGERQQGLVCGLWLSCHNGSSWLKKVAAKESKSCARTSLLCPAGHGYFGQRLRWAMVMAKTSRQTD